MTRLHPLRFYGVVSVELRSVIIPYHTGTSLAVATLYAAVLFRMIVRGPFRTCRARCRSEEVPA